MTGEIWEYVLLGIVLAACIGYMVQKGRRKFGANAQAGCGGCCGGDEETTCGTTAKVPDTRTSCG